MQSYHKLLIISFIISQYSTNASQAQGCIPAINTFSQLSGAPFACLFLFIFRSCLRF